MLYLKVRNGLANRMRVIASACTLAEKYDQFITVFWPVSQDCRVSYEQLFQAHPRIKIVNYLFKYDFRIIWTMLISKMKINHLRLQDEDALRRLSNHLECSRNVFVNTSEQFFELSGYRMFCPASEIIDAANRLFPLSTSSLCCGVHIRRTDNITSCEASPTELFIEKIAGILKDAPETRFYLATDSPEDEKRILAAFPGKIIVNSQKHLSRNSAQGIEDALIDLVCLSRCPLILGSYWSSFSEAAAAWEFENVSSQLVIVKKEQ